MGSVRGAALDRPGEVAGGKIGVHLTLAGCSKVSAMKTKGADLSGEREVVEVASAPAERGARPMLRVSLPSLIGSLILMTSLCHQGAQPSEH